MERKFEYAALMGELEEFFEQYNYEITLALERLVALEQWVAAVGVEVEKLKAASNPDTQLAKLTREWMQGKGTRTQYQSLEEFLDQRGCAFE